MVKTENESKARSSPKIVVKEGKTVKDIAVIVSMYTYFVLCVEHQVL